MYPILQIPEDAARDTEPLGTKRKFWFVHPEYGWMLCKIPRPNTGEDWSEKAAAELAVYLQLPCARYELGELHSGNCVISADFRPPGSTLIHGNELLGKANPSYGSQVSRFKQRAHTVEGALDTLTRLGCGLPSGWMPPPPIRSASEVFAGYLLLDALIGNTDRHDENWGVIQYSDGSLELARTYDHASCLGCHLSDDNRSARLMSSDKGYQVEAFAEKARSAFYLSPDATKPMSTLGAFHAAVKDQVVAAAVWLEKLQALTEVQIDAVLSAIPSKRFSDASRRFARRMLVHNKRRILDTGWNS